MTVSIRQATMADYVELCAVLDEGDAHHRKALPHLFRQPDGPARSRAYIASVIDNPYACFFVAERDGRIVGALHILLRETRDIPILVPRRFAVIENLIVSKPSRRTGIGRALMERAHQWALEQNVTEVELNVWEFNKSARALYVELGYETTKRSMNKLLVKRDV